MVRNMLVVAALLLTVLTATAAAADSTEHPSQNAQKLLSSLNSYGINNKEIQSFVEEANSHVENGYINFASQNVLGGELALRYPLNVPNASHRLELNYSPEDSHFAVTARTNGVIASYQLKF